jgi:hypothetical protein
MNAERLTPGKWLDRSLKTLNCEVSKGCGRLGAPLTWHQEEYRGRGLAKAVILRLFHEKIANFGQDGFSHVDVAVENLQVKEYARV